MRGRSSQAARASGRSPDRPSAGLRARVFTDQRHNWALLARFALVGASGVLVNMAVLVLLKRIGPEATQPLLPIPGTRFNVRWYHAFSTLAFVVANLWNFQLNRSWAFRSSRHAPWLREFGPFFVVGLLGQAIGLATLTALMHPGSIVSLPTSVLDGSSGLRTKLYWAQLITLGITTPVSFLLNKVWTFAAVRHVRRDAATAHASAEPADPSAAGTAD